MKKIKKSILHFSLNYFKPLTCPKVKIKNNVKDYGAYCFVSSDLFLNSSFECFGPTRIAFTLTR